MLVLGGSASSGLDIPIARLLGAEHAQVATTSFPDGEIKVRIPESVGGDVVIVQSTYQPQERHLFELLLIADYLREKGCRITAVVPYLGYARQDRSFIPGEAVSIRTVLNTMRGVGITRLVTVNPHKEASLGHFDGEVTVVNAIAPLARMVKDRLVDPFVLAPDAGGLELAKRASGLLGCEYASIDKRRDAEGRVSIVGTHGGGLGGKDVVIFDDIISTGGTIELAARFAYGQGARSVSAAGVHLVMAGGARERLRDANVATVFGTNTMPSQGAEIADIGPEIAECLK